MDSRTASRSKLLIVLILAALAGLLWLVYLLLAYAEFQNSLVADPLAALNSLSPLYWAALVFSALSCLACFFWGLGSRSLHVFVLTLLAAVLWLTPYLLTGFVRLPDSPWHVGAAVHIPDVLDGVPVVFSDYAWDFPGSFVYHYGLMELLDVSPMPYIDVFPAVCMVAFVVLCYAVIARLFDSRVALLSLLLAIPGLHYLQLHASPHAVGALLMLAALLLLVVGRGRARVLPVVAVLIIVVIVAHPTTPLLISIFLGSALLVGLVQLRKVGRAQVALAGLLGIAFVGWFFWYAFYPGSEWKTAGDIYQGVTAGQAQAGAGFLTSSGFIYGGIFALNKAIYFLYAAAGLLAVLVVAARACFRRTGIGLLVSGLFGLGRNEAILAISVVPLLVLTFLLAGRTHVLIETGLTYIILAISCVVASVAVRTRRIEGWPGLVLLVVAVLFLAVTFPVVAYSIDAYSNFPKSEEAGLRFLAERGALNDKTVASSSVSQLALHDQSLLVGGIFYDLNQRSIDRLSEAPDIAAFRNTGYYYAAMRFDLSFEDNRHTRGLEYVESAGYKKIYSSPTFQIYSDR